jgi:predicted DNA-binding protein
MSKTDDKKTKSVRVSSDNHVKVKIKSAQTGKTISEIIDELIEENLDDKKKK